jgi:hypothetical protein
MRGAKMVREAAEDKSIRDLPQPIAAPVGCAAPLQGDTSDYHLTKELCRGINRREKVTSYGVERLDRKRSCRVFLRDWMAG